MTLTKYATRPVRRNNVDDVFDNFFNWHLSRPVDYDNWSPVLDLKETEDAYVLALETPGMDRKDLNIQFKDGILSVSGEKKRETRNENDQYHRIERSYGSFTRQVRVLGDVKYNDIKAAYDNGVLTVTLPKAEEAKPKQISIE